MQKQFRNEMEFYREFFPGPPGDKFHFKNPPMRDKGFWSEGKFGRPFPKNIKGPAGAKSVFPLYGLILIFTASISIKLIEKWKNDEKQRTEIEKENISTELQFLKQQVNPHFLFNALNSVYSLTIHSSKPASDAILKLSSILRYMLYETENKLVKLKDELEIIENYIALQKLRLTEKVTVIFIPEGNANNLMIAPLLLLPIIENAFKHGIDNVKQTIIEIKIFIAGTQFEMLVKNRIVNKGLEQDDNSGIGIKNVKRRLDLLYPDNYHLKIDEGGDIFSIQLKMNLTI